MEGGILILSLPKMKTRENIIWFTAALQAHRYTSQLPPWTHDISGQHQLYLWIHWIYIRFPFLFSLYSLPILNTILETWILELHATILYNPHSILSFPHWTTYITHSVASLLCYPIPLHSACVHNITLNHQAQIPVTWLKTLHLVISQTIPFWCQSYFAVQVTWKDRFALGWHSTIGSVVAAMLLWEMLINARLQMDVQHSCKYCYLMKNTFW